MCHTTRLLAILLICLAITACSHAQDDGVPEILVVATYGVWPFVNGTDAGSGFEPAVMRALCYHLNITCQFISAASLEDRLEIVNKPVSDGGADCSLGSISVTPARKKVVDFVQPYHFSSGVIFFAPAGSVNTEQGWAGLKGKSVCVRDGYYASDVVSPYGINLSIVPTNSTAAESQKLVQERIVSGKCIGYLSDSSFAEVSGFPQVRLPPLETAPYGIALAKGRDSLRMALSAASVEIMNEGAVSDIFKIENEYLVSYGLSPNIDVADMVAALSYYDFSDSVLHPVSSSAKLTTVKYVFITWFVLLLAVI